MLRKPLGYLPYGRLHGFLHAVLPLPRLLVVSELALGHQIRSGDCEEVVPYESRARVFYNAHPQGPDGIAAGIIALLH